MKVTNCLALQLLGILNQPYILCCRIYSFLYIYTLGCNHAKANSSNVLLHSLDYHDCSQSCLIYLSKMEDLDFRSSEISAPAARDLNNDPALLAVMIFKHEI